MKDSLDCLVHQALADHLGWPEGQIHPALELRRDLNLLPLDLVLIALRLEDVASMHFPAERLDSVATVSDLVHLLRTSARSIEQKRRLRAGNADASSFTTVPPRVRRHGDRTPLRRHRAATA
jgi:acyl carrier protein